MAKIGILLSAAVLLLAGCRTNSPRSLIAEDNAKEAAVLAAARDAAEKLDGTDEYPTHDDVQALIGSDFQTSGGGDVRSYGIGRSVATFEITNREGSHFACLKADITFINFVTTVKASADPGAC